MRRNTTVSERWRAVVLAALVVVSMGTVGATLSGGVLAQDGLAVEVSEETVEPDGQTTVTLEATEAEHLRIVGETDGWTVEEVEPLASLIGNPTTSDSLPYESGTESWFYAETTHDQLVVDLQATVPQGTYQFTAQELDAEDNVVAEEEFTIDVQSDDEQEDEDDDEQADGDDRDEDGEQDDALQEETEFTATNSGGVLVIGGEETTEIQLAPEQLEISGVIDERAGTWESTEVAVDPIEIGGLQFSVAVPDGFEGEFDRETETITVRGEIVITTMGDEIRFDIAGTSDAVGATVDLEDDSAQLIDDTFVVAETGDEMLDRALGLPAAEPGQNHLELPLEFDIKATEPGPPTVDVEAVTFEDVAVNDTETLSTTVTNTGERSIEVELSLDDEGAFEVNGDVIHLEPGEEATVSLTFAPDRSGEFETTLSVYGSDGLQAGNATIAGEATAAEESGLPDDIGPGFGPGGTLVALVAAITFLGWRRTG